MRSIKQIEDVNGKRALVRVDFNVPIEDGEVRDDFRIRSAIPTIKFLLGKHAKVVLITHLGKDGTQYLDPVKKRFYKLSGFSPKLVEFFENVRKDEGEKNNDPEFAKKLASLGDFYVNDAFSVSHRNHASVVGVPKLLPAYAGLQLQAEIEGLSKITKNPSHPFLFILGGAKFSTKIPLIQKYLSVADFIFVGGALSNSILKERGYNVGASLVDDSVSVPPEILGHLKIVSPVEVLVETKGSTVLRKVNEIQNDDSVIDIGPESIKLLKSYIDRSKLILWNGPLGKYEGGGDKATKEIMKYVLHSKAEVVIGGGDLTAVFDSLMSRNLFLRFKAKNKKNLFVSTGGGAMLEFLTQGTLPGIEALG